MYGGLLINVASSMNEMIVEAHKGGKVVFKAHGDKSFIELFQSKEEIFEQSHSNIQ